MLFFGFNPDSWVSVVAMIGSGLFLTYSAWKGAWFKDEEEEGD